MERKEAPTADNPGTDKEEAPKAKRTRSPGSMSMIEPRFRNIYKQFYKESYFTPTTLDLKTKELIAIGASLLVFRGLSRHQQPVPAPLPGRGGQPDDCRAPAGAGPFLSRQRFDGEPSGFRLFSGGGCGALPLWVAFRPLRSPMVPLGWRAGLC